MGAPSIPPNLPPDVAARLVIRAREDGDPDLEPEVDLVDSQTGEVVKTEDSSDAPDASN